MRELFADFSVVAAPAAPPGAVDAYYDDLARPYGVRLPPPERLQRQVVDDLLMAGRAADAQHALDLLAAGYGEPRDIDALRERIAEAARQPEPTETVETLLAHPFPTPADAKSWVGEWRGETWTRPEARTPMALRVRVDGARVAAEVVTWPMADQEAVQAVGHLRFDGDRIAFGYLNGMRPRGVLLYEGERSGERLAGQMRLAGMEFRMPDGRELPAVYFDLRRER